MGKGPKDKVITTDKQVNRYNKTHGTENGRGIVKAGDHISKSRINMGIQMCLKLALMSKGGGCHFF